MNRAKAAKRQKVAPRRRQRQQTGIMRIAAPPERPWNLNPEEIALVKNHIAKGASDEELKFCLAVSRRYKLDPFRQQIWFVKRKDNSAEGGYRWIPIVGINGLLHVAARDHRKEFGTNDEPEFGQLHAVKFQKNGQGATQTLQAPEWARVQVWKNGSQHPTVATVYWDEIYPNVDYAPLVRQMPRLMLGKCALAQAVRRTYPATDGLYISEEFQGRPEFTTSGRELVYPEEQENKYLNKFEEREKEQLANLQPPKAIIPEIVTEAAPALFYVHHSVGRFEVTGDQTLKTANKDVLAPLWDSQERTILADAKQLGKLIRTMEERKVPFRALEKA